MRAAATATLRSTRASTTLSISRASSSAATSSAAASSSAPPVLGSDRPAKDGSTSTSASSSKARLEPTARSSVTPAPDAVGTTRTASQNFQSDEDRRLAAKYGLEPRPLKQSVGGVPLVYGATPMERAQAAGEKRPQLPAKQRSSMTGRRVRVNPATPKGPARLVYPAPKKGDRAPQPAVPLVPFTRDELGLKPPQRRAWDQLVATSQQRPLTPAEIKDLAKLRTLGKKQGFKQAHLSDVRGRLSDLAARTPDEAIASAARSALGMTPMPVGRPDPNRPDEYLNRRTVDVSGTVASAEGSAGAGEDERAPSLGSLDEAADRFMQRTERAVKGGSDEPTLDDLDSLRPDHLLAKPLPDKHQTVEQINNWYMSRIDVSCLAILRAFDLKQLVRLCTLAGVTVRPSEDRGSRRTWARALVTQRWKVIVPPLDALARSDTSPIVLEDVIARTPRDLFVMFEPLSRLAGEYGIDLTVVPPALAMLERQRGGAYAVVRLTGRQQTVGVVMTMYNRIKGPETARRKLPTGVYLSQAVLLQISLRSGAFVERPAPPVPDNLLLITYPLGTLEETKRLIESAIRDEVVGRTRSAFALMPSAAAAPAALMPFRTAERPPWQLGGAEDLERLQLLRHAPGIDAPDAPADARKSSPILPAGASLVNVGPNGDVVRQIRKRDNDRSAAELCDLLAAGGIARIEVAFGHQLHRHREETTAEPIDAFLHALHLRTLRPTLCPSVPSNFAAALESSSPTSQAYRELVYRPAYHSGKYTGTGRMIRLRFIPPQESAGAVSSESTAVTETSGFGEQNLADQANLDLAPVLAQLEAMPESALGHWEIEASLEHECNIISPGGSIDACIRAYTPAEADRGWRTSFDDRSVRYPGAKAPKLYTSTVTTAAADAEPARNRKERWFLASDSFVRRTTFGEGAVQRVVVRSYDRLTNDLPSSHGELRLSFADRVKHRPLVEELCRQVLDVVSRPNVAACN